MFKSFDTSTSLELAKYPLQFYLLFIKDLFSEFSLNEFLMNSYEPLVRYLWFVSQIEFSGLHYCLFVNVLCLLFILPCQAQLCQNITSQHFLSSTFLNFFVSSFISMCEIKIVCCRFICLPQRRRLSYHSIQHMSTGNYIFFYLLKLPTHELTFAH